MNDVTFIGVEFVKDNSNIDDNVSDKVLVNAIKDAQVMYIQQVLGTDLYKRIVKEVEANIDSTTPYEEGVVDLLTEYIQPCLLKWVEVEFAPSNHFKTTNGGLSTETGQGHQAAAVESLRSEVSRSLRKAEFYQGMLSGFLQDNTELFPEYLTNSDSSDISPEDESLNTGLWLG